MKFNFIKGGKCFQNSARLSCCQLFIRGIPVVLIILPVELSYSEFCSGFQHAIVRDCFQICPIQLSVIFEVPASGFFPNLSQTQLLSEIEIAEIVFKVLSVSFVFFKFFI